MTLIDEILERMAFNRIGGDAVAVYITAHPEKFISNNHDRAFHLRDCPKWRGHSRCECNRLSIERLYAETQLLRSRLALLEKVAAEAWKSCADSHWLPSKELLEAIKALDEKP